MDQTLAPHQLIQQLLDLQNRYARTPRAIVTRERFQHALVAGKRIEVEDISIREPLTEHVGHLPIIATFLYPYIAHKKEVDLGRALIMIAIHDIGETMTGDILTYRKSDTDTEEENIVARSILSPELVPYFDEFELRETLDAKFAKTADALGPLLHEIDMPKLTRQRFEVHGFNSTNIETKKRVLFEWDKTMLDVFDTIMETYHKIERDEPTGFTMVTDLRN